MRTVGESTSAPECNPRLSLASRCESIWRNVKISDPSLFTDGARGEAKEDCHTDSYFHCQDK